MSFPVYAPPPPPPPSRSSRGRWLRTAFVAVPTLAVVAGAASVITLAIAGDHPETAGSGHAATATTASAGRATVGTLTAQDGSAWVVKTTKGASVTVQVGASTSFGTKAHPATSSAFHTGAKVKVVGTPSGTTVEAKRVVLVGGTTGGDRAG